MADPLSIAAGVVGILTAAAQISSLLVRFTKSSKNAPVQARRILAEVDDISTILSHLQSYLLGRESVDCSRTSLLKVDQVVTIVSGCVMTFSELERLLDEMEADHMNVLTRIKWARKEGEIQLLVQRLQNHKSSLSLVTNILNGDSITEAKVSVDRLFALVDKSYQEMSRRVHALESRESQAISGTRSIVPRENESTIPILLDVSLDGASTPASNQEDSNFWEELEKSRVYRRIPSGRESIFSIDQTTITSSYLSRLSVAEVSNISVINLVITLPEVHNPHRLSQSWSDNHIQQTSSFQPVAERTTQITVPIDQDMHAIPPVPSAPFETEGLPNTTIFEDAQFKDFTTRCLAIQTAKTRSMAIPSASDVLVLALYSFESDVTTDLRFRRGDTIQVIGESGSGWGFGITSGVRGWFPMNYCEPIPCHKDATAGNTQLLSSITTSVANVPYTIEESNLEESHNLPSSASVKSPADNGENQDQEVTKDSVKQREFVSVEFIPGTENYIISLHL